LVYNNFNQITENEEIDDFIQKMQLEISYYDNIALKWISYNQFNKIKEMGKNSSITIYSAVWRNGPLCYNSWYTRETNKEVSLKCLHNSKNLIEFLINEVYF
jgi:hypothetical protein